MIKINYVSDLHLEFQDLILPGGDVLILAGDILVAGYLRQADNAGRNTVVADKFRRFINEELNKYNKVIYIPGNHEYYNNEYEDTFDRIKKELPANVNFLHNQIDFIDNIPVYAGIGWTDANKADPITMMTLRDSLNDFKCIKLQKHLFINNRWINKFDPILMIKEHNLFIEGLNQFLYQNKGREVIVISHHAPCFLSVNDRYKNEYHLNGGYASDLSAIIGQNTNIKYWIHGHMHNSVNYELFDTKIISNPRGYIPYEPNPEFDVNKAILM